MIGLHLNQTWFYAPRWPGIVIVDGDGAYLADGAYLLLETVS